ERRGLGFPRSAWYQHKTQSLRLRLDHANRLHVHAQVHVHACSHWQGNQRALFAVDCNDCVLCDGIDLVIDGHGVIPGIHGFDHAGESRPAGMDCAHGHLVDQEFAKDAGAWGYFGQRPGAAIHRHQCVFRNREGFPGHRGTTVRVKGDGEGDWINRAYHAAATIAIQGWPLSVQMQRLLLIHRKDEVDVGVGRQLRQIARFAIDDDDGILGNAVGLSGHAGVGFVVEGNGVERGVDRLRHAAAAIAQVRTFGADPACGALVYLEVHVDEGADRNLRQLTGLAVRVDEGIGSDEERLLAVSVLYGYGALLGIHRADRIAKKPSSIGQNDFGRRRIDELPQRYVGAHGYAGQCARLAVDLDLGILRSGECRFTDAIGDGQFAIFISHGFDDAYDS